MDLSLEKLRGGQVLDLLGRFKQNYYLPEGRWRKKDECRMLPQASWIEQLVNGRTITAVVLNQWGFCPLGDTWKLMETVLGAGTKYSTKHRSQGCTKHRAMPREAATTKNYLA